MIVISFLTLGLAVSVVGEVDSHKLQRPSGASAEYGAETTKTKDTPNGKLLFNYRAT